MKENVLNIGKSNETTVFLFQQPLHTVRNQKPKSMGNVPTI